MIKAGDKVKIIARIDGHGLDIGSIQTITGVDEDDFYWIEEGQVCWAVGDDEIELIKDVTQHQ